jgi:hypothetical protein
MRMGIVRFLLCSAPTLFEARCHQPNEGNTAGAIVDTVLNSEASPPPSIVS